MPSLQLRQTDLSTLQTLVQIAADFRFLPKVPNSALCT
jgi:hypothetical protein